MSATITDEQFAARDLVRSWAAGAAAPAAVREIEHGRHRRRGGRSSTASPNWDCSAWPSPRRSAEPAERSVDLCAMVEEAARALVPGPIATTALATLRGRRSGYCCRDLPPARSPPGSRSRRTCATRAAGCPAPPSMCSARQENGVLLLPVGDRGGAGDAADANGVVVEPLAATDFSRPLARVTLDGAPFTRWPVSRRRFQDLAATVLAAEACRGDALDAGHRRWITPRCASSSASRSAASRPSNTCAPRCCCAAQQIAVAAGDAAVAAAGADADQLSIAAAVAAAVGIEAADGQCQGLHSGARRYRDHLGARRPPLPAAGLRAGPVPRRPIALVAAGRDS